MCYLLHAGPGLEPGSDHMTFAKLALRYTTVPHQQDTINAQNTSLEDAIVRDWVSQSRGASVTSSAGPAESPACLLHPRHELKLPDTFAVEGILHVIKKCTQESVDRGRPGTTVGASSSCCLCAQASECCLSLPSFHPFCSCNVP